MQKTPLYSLHLDLKARMVPFGGWNMPVFYESVIAEHKNVRTQCGIFDVSHMGEFKVMGQDAARFLNYACMNNVDKLKHMQGQYSGLLNEKGGFVDDLIVYRLGDNEFFLCVNASNTPKVEGWLEKISKSFDVSIVNESSRYAQIALQGPTTARALKPIFSSSDLEKLCKTEYCEVSFVNFKDHKLLAARTGYTGELGFEFYLDAELAPSFWQSLLATKSESGVCPIGLGARDTLRLEACYLLYGNEMNETVSPLEAGVAWAVDLKKENFLGKDALAKEKSTGLLRKLCCFRMKDEGIARHDMQVYDRSDHLIGIVTSGSILPTVGGAGGMMLLKSSHAVLDQEVFVDIRGQRKKAQIVKRPLYEARTKDDLLNSL